jgi:hypothetical protein
MLNWERGRDAATPDGLVERGHERRPAPPRYDDRSGRVLCRIHISWTHLEDILMRWKIGQAKQRFSEAVRRAAMEPQLICNRERVVAAVIDAGAAERLQAMRARESQRSIADAFEEFRELVKRERYVVKIPSRRSRRDAFADALDHLSR